MYGFTEIHAHCIYGVDDGAKTREDMQVMLDAANAEGIASLYSTPHVIPGVRPFDEATYRAHLDEARAYCAQMGYQIALHAGAEILYTPAVRQVMQERRLPTLEGTDRVLVEFVPDVSCKEIEAALECMEFAGVRPILAHIERYKCLYGGRAQKLKARHDVRFQMNCSTVLQKQGFLKQLEINRWLTEGLIDFVASDAHDSAHRRFRIREAYAALAEKCGTEEAARMTGCTWRQVYK